MRMLKVLQAMSLASVCPRFWYRKLKLEDLIEKGSVKFKFQGLQ